MCPGMGRGRCRPDRLARRQLAGNFVWAAKMADKDKRMFTAGPCLFARPVHGAAGTGPTRNYGTYA